MFGWFKKSKAKSKTPIAFRQLPMSAQSGIFQAFYDGADISDTNANHFLRATSANPDAHGSPAQRKKVRNNSRYEVENNNYLKGMIRSYRNDLIGTVPRLQLLLGSAFREKLDPKVIRRISAATEYKWSLWAKEIRLGRKFRAMAKARVVDGEAFAIIKTNEKLPGPIKLDLKLIACDRIGNPQGQEHSDNPNIVDGIEFDDCDRPVRYHVYKYHPGDPQHGGRQEGEWVDAKYMIHWYTLESPEQHHGVGEMQGSLSPAASSRRWRAATLNCIEAAAGINGFIHTDHDDVDGDVEACTPFDEIQMPHNSWLSLPDTWKASQMKAEHPTSGYSELHQQTTTEQGRVLGMHRAKCTGDASDYNYASVQFDDQDYKIGITVDRDDITYDLDRLGIHWWNEAILVESYLPNEIRQMIGPDDYPEMPQHEWHFDGRGHVDPGKEATAAAKRMESGQSNPISEAKSNGLDAEQMMEEAARAYGLTLEEYQKKLCEKTFGNGMQNQQDGGDDDGEAEKRKGKQAVERQKKATAA